MPELPEVEVNRRNLERWLRGRRVARACVLDRKVTGGQPPRAVESALRGARVRAVGRRAKYLTLDLGPRGKVVAHLGMTGKFLFRKAGEEDPRGVRVALWMDGGRRVLFSDLRRFGSFQLLKKEGERTLSALGVEPLSREFTPRRLAEGLGGSRLPIKLWLMDQSRVAGLGNIQAAEALFLAGIHPSRPAGRLSRMESARLHRAIRKTLTDTLEKASGPEVTYLEERAAASENPFRVYGREGEPCPRCRASIRRQAQGGRSTFFCPRCQKG